MTELLKKGCHIYIVTFNNVGDTITVDTVRIGGGFYIGGGLFVTCSHLFDQEKLANSIIKIKNWNGKYIEVVVSVTQVGRDLAILRVKNINEFLEENFIAVDVHSNTQYKVGAPVYAIHNPSPSYSFTYSRGAIAYLYKGAGAGPAENAEPIMELVSKGEDLNFNLSMEEVIELMDLNRLSFINQPFFRTFPVVTEEESYDPIVVGTPIIQVSGILVSHGSSGCPVFEMDTNVFVGMIIGKLGGAADSVVLIPSDLISLLVKEVEVRWAPIWDNMLAKGKLELESDMESEPDKQISGFFDGMFSDDENNKKTAPSDITEASMVQVVNSDNGKEKLNRNWEFLQDISRKFRQDYSGDLSSLIPAVKAQVEDLASFLEARVDQFTEERSDEDENKLSEAVNIISDLKKICSLLDKSDPDEHEIGKRLSILVSRRPQADAFYDLYMGRSVASSEKNGAEVKGKGKRKKTKNTKGGGKRKRKR